MRRRDLLENVAFAQGREAQAGAKTAEGSFVGSYPFAGDASIELYFYFSQAEEASQLYPAVFGNYPGIVVYNAKNTDIQTKNWQVTCYANGLDYTILFQLADGWRHVVFVLKGLEATVYIDGIEAKAMTYPVYPLSGAGFVLGNFFPADPTLSARAYKESIAYSRLFNYALTAAEVATLWNGGNPAGYVLPEAWKTMPNSYDSDFTSGANGWVTHTLGTVVRAEDRVLRISSSTTDYKIRRRQEGALLKPAKYEIVVELAEPTIGPIGRFVYFPFTGMNGAVTRNIPAGTTLLRGMVSVDRELAEYSYLYFLGVDTPQTFKIKSISVKPVGCVAEYLPQNLVAVDGIGKSWLDSSRQLPLNDEYLPPLRGSIGGYDLTASGAPQIAHKPMLCQTWRKMLPMTLEGFDIRGEVDVPPQIVDGALRITCSGIDKSYDGGGCFDKIVTANVGDVVKWRFKIRASSTDVQMRIGMAKAGNLYYAKAYANISAEWTIIEENATSSYPLDNFWISKNHTYTGLGWFEIKDIEILIYRK